MISTAAKIPLQGPRLLVGITPAFTKLVAVVALFLTISAALIVNEGSLFKFGYYLISWYCFIFVFHKNESGTFIFAFMFNSALISIYYLIQTHVYPDSYGTTSPLGSWTDDSFFFSLIADSVPPGLETRVEYFAYSHPYSSFIAFISPFQIHHPMDSIFFQSGIAAVLATFTRLFMIQNRADEPTANAAFLMVLICPFLLMNGGALHLRDTMSAALFIYSLSCLNSGRWPLAVLAGVAQLAIRPGTALILVPAYFIIFLPSTKDVNATRLVAFFVGLPAAVLLGAAVGSNLIDVSVFLNYFDRVNLDGREIIADLKADASANQIFLAIQDQPFLIKFFLNGIYMFLYPFFSPSSAFAGIHFDTRAVLLNFVAPIEAIWLNAWFFAGVLTRKKALLKQRNLVVAMFVSLLAIGTYSLQTRHKTIIYPLYYAIVAVGLVKSTSAERRLGYALSGLIFAVELFVAFRS